MTPFYKDESGEDSPKPGLGKNFSCKSYPLDSV